MPTLFAATVTDSDVPAIPGLSYRPNYLSKAEERALVEAIDSLPWDTQWRRRRQPYGGAYGKGGTAPPIPPWGQELAERLLAEGITPVAVDHMLVNEYLPGQGIALHRDYEPYGRTVVSISLLSSCIMDFRRCQDGRQERLLLEPRSLLVLSDEARYDWEHGIAPRKKDSWHGMIVQRERRLSITFRFQSDTSKKPRSTGGNHGARAPAPGNDVHEQ
jgi:alkylated DNA repair dioxygenase AlkB